MATKNENTTPEQQAAEQLVENPNPVAPTARLISLNNTKLYQVTIKDMYEKDSPGYKDESLRQIFYYTANNASELQERLIAEFPKYKEFSINLV
jgi:hypothetical protein